MVSIRVSALEYVQKISDGEFTAEEFLSGIFSRIRQVEPKLHAYLHVEREEAALAQAREVDRKIRSGQRAGLCAGMPVSVKDNICRRGWRTTCG